MNFKKIISALCLCTLGFQLTTYPLNANASGQPILRLKVNNSEDYIAYAGEKVTFTYEIDGKCEWSTSGIHFNYDSRLIPDGDGEGNIYFSTGDAISEMSMLKVYHRTGIDINSNIAPANSGVPDISQFVSPEQNCIFVTTSSNINSGKDGIVISIDFTVPEDAQDGDTYEFNFWFLKSDMFTDVDKDKSMQEYAFTAPRNCSITVGNISKLKGDANLDEVVDVADVVAVASYIGNPEKNVLSEQGISNADVHSRGNGINANDALLIQQYIAKIIDSLD
ncbi:MAG: hypothetical protein K2G63_00845 [Oscillospiraceae bacterium]|nr:hypothetical protein [Oscillospiraceae bacterium]